MTIPVMRPWLGEEEAAAAAAAVASGWVAQGPRVAEFEQAFAATVDVPYAVAVSSCTTALHLCLVAAGVGPGDEVIVPSLSFIATANAVRYVGATPVFADSDPRTGCLTAVTVAPLLGAATRAVILVDQGGIPADLDELRALCDPLGIPVIEDAACALGATYRGRPAASGAVLAAFSFHPRKVITTGEGGMVTTHDVELARRLKQLREHGMTVSAADRHTARQPVLEAYGEVGFNYRMTDIQAAVGLVQLRKLRTIVARRRDLAERYVRALADIPGLITAADPWYGTTNFQSFWVLPDQDCPVSRDDLLAALAAGGVSARRGIMAAHLEPAYADPKLSRSPVPLPVTERLTCDSLILPLYHQLTEAEQDQVIALFRSALGASARRSRGAVRT